MKKISLLPNGAQKKIINNEPMTKARKTEAGGVSYNLLAFDEVEVGDEIGESWINTATGQTNWVGYLSNPEERKNCRFGACHGVVASVTDLGRGNFPKESTIYRVVLK